jgi:hypothetical protein
MRLVDLERLDVLAQAWEVERSRLILGAVLTTFHKQLLEVAELQRAEGKRQPYEAETIAEPEGLHLWEASPG